MGAPCFLKTMGYPELRTPDGRPVRFKVRKHLALLVYFAVDGRASHRREALVDLLWSGVPVANGRHSLSMALTVLRAVLGPDAIRSSTAQVRVLPRSVTLDLDRLYQGDLCGGAATPPLDVAGFLSEFEIADAPAFQHWRDRQQAQLLPSIQAGLLALIDQARRSGDMPGVMRLAERLLSLDPLAEEGIRARMEAFALQGDRLGALRVYEEWRELLRAELGAAPSDLLEGIAARLRRRGLDHSPAGAGPPVHTDHWADRRFVGRAAEYQVLYGAWESTTQLDTRHVLVTGETGVGKSTLAMRFGTAAALEGAAVARVQCFELEQRIAFGMIGALVTALLDRPGAVATAPSALAEIARMVPRVRERFPALPAPGHTEGEAARLHFAEGTFALFDAIMEEQPLLLIIDDYPRSDEASLSVLHMLLRRMGSERLMVVLTGRPPEPDEPPQSARIRKGLAYLPMVRLDLGPLSEAESEELLMSVAGAAGKSPGLPERRAILGAAGGNPMAIELLTQDWAAHGDAAMAVSIPAMRVEVPAAALESVGYDRVLERLLPALPPRTRAALQLATILGPRLNDLDSFAMLGLTSAQIMAALGELMERRVLRDAGAGFEFTNELIRARLYLKIPSALRTRLHSGIAERLLSRSRAGEDVPGLEIAWHCIRSRRREDATPYLMKGARDAIMHGAPDEAARALSSAIGHLKGRAKDEAALLLAETYQEMAQWREALYSLSLIDPTGREDPSIGELANALQLECIRQLESNDVQDLCQIASQLIDIVQNGSVPAARARAATMVSGVASDLKDERIYSRIEGVLRTLDEGTFHGINRARILLAKALISFLSRRNGVGLSEVRVAATLLEADAVMDTTYVRIQTGLGVIPSRSGKYDEGIGPLERAYAAAARLDHLPLMCQAAFNVAICFYRLGVKQEYRRWAQLAWAASKHLPVGSYESVCAAAHLALAHYELEEGRWADEGLILLERSACCSKIPWIMQAAELYRADICWLMGRKRAAFSAATRARGIARSALSTGLAGAFARWSTLTLLRAGRPNDAWMELQATYEQLPRLDAIDQAEVLCAIRLVGAEIPIPIDDIDAIARERLAALPTHCSIELGRLGLLAH